MSGTWLFFSPKVAIKKLAIGFLPKFYIFIFTESRLCALHKFCQPKLCQPTAADTIVPTEHMYTLVFGGDT